ncbi:MAG: GAF domain-containing protein [Candidatus Limnocylindrales bacterium]
MHNEPTISHKFRAATQGPLGDTLLTVGGAADLLGVHANTVRSWTDQGLITCLRINKRGDRRYRHEEIERFLDRARTASEPATGSTDSEPRPQKVVTRHARSVRAEPEGARTRAILDETARVCAEADSFDRMVGDVALVMCTVGGYSAAALVGENTRPTTVVGRMRSDRRIVGQVMSTHRPSVGPLRGPDPGYKAGLPVCGVNGAGISVLLLEGDSQTRTGSEMELLSGVAAQLATASRMRARILEASAGRRQAELLMAISSDIGSQLDLPHVLTQLADGANDLFEADHTGVFSRMPNGSFKTRATHNLSADFCQMVEHAIKLPASAVAFEESRIVSVMNYPDDPRALELRHGVVKEGINTITVAPMISDGEALGVLALFHDTPHEWDAEQNSLLEQLARQAATMLRNAQNYSQMATWAAQLQSIQQLGARLTRLRSVGDIGHAICAELNQLIDYHNVRVYRIDGDECVPVAWRGEIGEYEGEDVEQLRLQVGQGITGWVARHGLAQNVGDAANDDRARTIPGTEADLDESLLLAPMLYEDEVMGVIVLAKLGLNQFTSDDLRLLEIYASIAAQAMANADATERLRAQSEALERQLNSQRELLRVTESILSTLDTQALLEEIAERLKSLVQVDNIAVDIHDQRAGLLRPIFARGVHALDYLASTIKDTMGVAGSVLKSGEAELVQDELADTRVAHFAALGPLPGALIVAPLRSGARVQGLLTIERLGAEARFTEEEFDLVKLFAAHVSIALQNAEAHRAVELKAETDTLTGLWNHGALINHIDQLVNHQAKFSMLMVDLDFFKRYNDRFGHQAGNVMLQNIATLLRGSGRATDEVFRYGGDEFALLLPRTSLAGARIVAEKIQAAVDSVNDGRLMPTPLTCSIGIAVFPKDGIDGESMILAADLACYAGKRGGRARIATALEGVALAAEFEPTTPTPIPSPQPPLSRHPSYTLA